MKYLLLSYTPAAAWDAATADVPSEEALAAFAAYQKFEQELPRDRRVRHQRGPRPPGGQHHRPQDRRRRGRDRRAVRRAQGGPGELRGHRRARATNAPSRSSPGSSTCWASRSRSGRSWATTSRDTRPRTSSTCCAPRRRRCSARWCGGSAASTLAEDAVQEALLAASRQWPADGVPGEPAQLADPDRRIGGWSTCSAPSRRGAAASRRPGSRAGHAGTGPPGAPARRDRRQPHPAAALLPPGAEPALPGGAHAARRGRPDDRRDRARVRDAEATMGDADQPRQAAAGPRPAPASRRRPTPTATAGWPP